MRLCLALGVLAAMGVLGAPTSADVPARPKYIECADNSECSSWECCLLGPGRFSLPRCTAVGDIGDPCRPEESYGAGQPVNLTVGYPDGQEVVLSAVHYIRCPCGAGLQCDRDHEHPVCAPPTEHDVNAL